MNAIEKTAVALPTPPTANDMLGFIDAAKDAYDNYKSNAMKSAAYAYLTWHWGASEHSEPDMRKWLDEQIDKANKGIEKFNSDVDNDKRRAKELAENKINEELTDEEKARLTALHKRTSVQWAQAKQVKIDARAGASKFTCVVKYVFGFVKPADASLVSRYAKVLEYIEQHKDCLLYTSPSPRD